MQFFVFCPHLYQFPVTIVEITVLLYSVLQIVIWFIIPAVRSSHSTNNALVLIVLLQYVPRLYLIFPLSSQIIKATGVVTKTAWAGAAYNLILYMLASHVCSFFYFKNLPIQFNCDSRLSNKCQNNVCSCRSWGHHGICCPSNGT